MALAIAAFSTQISPLFSQGDLNLVLASVWFFDRFYLDFLVFLLIASFMINSGIVLRVLSYIGLALLVGTYFVQFLSVYISGEFVSILAIDNINHASLFFNTGSMLALFAFLIVITLIIYVVESVFDTRVGIRSISVWCCALLAGGLLIDSHERWVGGAVLQVRDGWYQDRKTRIAHESPVDSLFQNLFRREQQDVTPFTAADAKRAKQYGFTIQPNQRFPLHRDNIFSAELPFASRPNAAQKPNVIIFFSEGLSARTTNVYGAKEPGLTPNMLEFAQQAMVVDNYFNHTFATYRGLHGQLCSIYPFHGGMGGWHTEYDSIKNVRYFCLSDLFNNAGYETIFLDTHRADAGYIDEMMFQLKFNRVINAEEVQQKYIHQVPLRPDALSDNQLMNGLIAALKEREGNNSGTPFLMATYNLETHAWQKVAADGKKYVHKDSYILDTIHNYDDAFGQFWNYFQTSTYRDNTIVILTADHAHYPDRDFVKLAASDPQYNAYFVDQIPLIIFDPGKTLPQRLDAGHRTSIDFAPTIAHLLGLNSDGAFLGSSIFEPLTDSPRTSVAAAGDEYFVIDESGVRRHDTPNSDVGQMDFIKRIIHTIHQLERHNRIQPDSESSD